MTTLKILGVNDEQTACDCCGRTDLKKTVILGELDADGNVTGEVRYGVVCAAHAMKTSAIKVRRGVKAVVDAAKKEAERIKEAAKKAEGDRWFAWLKAQTNGAETCRAIQLLGGFGKARAAFNAAQ